MKTSTASAILVVCSVLFGTTLACLPNLSGGGGGGCCPPGPTCHQPVPCGGSYVSPPAAGPASYAVPPPSYAQAPPSYAQPPPPPPPPPQYAQPAAPKYPTSGK